MEMLEKWLTEYIKDIDISNIEWIKLNSKELEEFFKENYLDKELWEYVYDKNAWIVYPPPLGMHYINFSSPSKKNFSFLLGVVNNNIGKKTIVCSMSYYEEYYIFTEQKVPITYISAMEVNSYFWRKGLFKRMCNEAINYINPEQHILCSEESDMGKMCDTFSIFRDTMYANGFENMIWKDGYSSKLLENEEFCSKVLGKSKIKSKKSTNL